jgi:translation elongation factor EF-4
MKNGEEVIVNNPCDYPDSTGDVLEEFEPVVNATVIVPLEHYSPISMLCRVTLLVIFFVTCTIGKTWS